MEADVMPDLMPAKNLEACHLRMARSGLGLTVRELAVLSDVNKATIVRVEAGLSVRDATRIVIRETLEAKGAVFLMSSQTKDVFVGIQDA